MGRRATMAEIGSQNIDDREQVGIVGVRERECDLGLIGVADVDHAQGGVCFGEFADVNGFGAAARGDCAGACRTWSERDGSTERQAICVQEVAFRSGHGVWWVGAGVRSGEFLKVGKADQDVAERHPAKPRG